MILSFETLFLNIVQQRLEIPISKYFRFKTLFFCSNILWALIVRIVTIRSQGIPRSVEVDFPLKHLNRFVSFRCHFGKIDKIGLFGAVLCWELAANWQSTWISRSISDGPVMDHHYQPETFSEVGTIDVLSGSHCRSEFQKQTKYQRCLCSGKSWDNAGNKQTVSDISKCIDLALRIHEDV